MKKLKFRSPQPRIGIHMSDLCVACRMSRDQCPNCGRTFCESHSDRCSGCGRYFCENCVGTYGCPECTPMLRARSQQIQREREEQRQRNILAFTDELLTQYRSNKDSQSSEKNEKAFKLVSTKDAISESVEKDRDKGGGLFKKRPEEQLVYSQLYLLPCANFEYQYLKKKGIFGPKILNTGATVLSLYEKGCKTCWRPELIKEIAEKGMDELKEGLLVDINEEWAENEAATAIAEAKFATVETVQLMKKNLNLEVAPEELQRLSRVTVVYLPYWIAKYKSPNTVRFIVYDRFGKKHDPLIEKINANPDFAEVVEKNVLEL